MRRLSCCWPVVVLGLLGLGACSKQDPEVVPAEVKNIASYQLNSRQVTCQPALVRSSDAGYDYLELRLLTTPQPVAGPEKLTLYFHKAGGQPATAYELDDVVLDDSDKLRGHPLSNKAVTITPTSNGGFSGTFSGDACVACGFSSQQSYQLRSGTFTDVRP